MNSLKGKRALILGLANDRSIAWGIAQALHAAGVKLAFNYLGESLERRVRPLAESLGAEIIEPCDVSSDEQITGIFGKIKEKWGGLDILVHSVAFAGKDDLHGRFVDTTRAGFKLALDVSAYSLIATSREAAKLMPETGGTILTLTYYGSEKVIPGYNVMGVAKAALEASVRYLAHDLGKQKIRVHAISAGPIKTLAAAGGISNFRDILNQIEEKAPLHENVSPEDIGALAAFLCQDGARHMTGNLLYVDSGFNIMGS
ncbi:MAG: enoyl-[acyl-carrier-protein] reductase FabI [Proteobacteria bacterium]|nr:enoyl-[acyl-carrier-protein] reductase FabI [Pseudomonadota bacterium]